MSVKQLNPYLNFGGTADQAIALYERVFGTKAEIMRFGDMPGGTVAPENLSRVMHGRLPIGPDVIMISDTPPGTPAPSGGNVQVCVHFDDVAELTRKFEALAEGGTVTMPLQNTFWAERFGMLTDRFGVHWMFNCEPAGA